MAKPTYIELSVGEEVERIPILYEDRSVLAIDKPSGWMLIPFSWQKTNRNLQAAITSSIAAKEFWARSRNLKFLRFVHRLDAETSGVLLMAKSMGALNTYGDLFEARKMEKIYLAVAYGLPKQAEWICRAKLTPEPAQIGKMKGDSRDGKEAETHFRVLQSRKDSSRGELTLIEARPVTGRTHQIRVHLREAGHPVVCDSLYGLAPATEHKTKRAKPGLGLRAVQLSYVDPFTRRRVQISATVEKFAGAYGFDLTGWKPT